MPTPEGPISHSIKNFKLGQSLRTLLTGTNKRHQTRRYKDPLQSPVSKHQVRFNYDETTRKSPPFHTKMNNTNIHVPKTIVSTAEVFHFFFCPLSRPARRGLKSGTKQKLRTDRIKLNGCN